MTGLARFSLLEKLDAAATNKSGFEGKVHEEILTAAEKAEWQRVVDRIIRICEAAEAKGHRRIDRCGGKLDTGPRGCAHHANDGTLQPEKNGDL